MIEREIKLSFASVEDARAALVAAGAEAFAPRRLQDDLLYDSAQKTLFEQRAALRLRREGDCALLTYKGPVQPGITKAREEIETEVENHEAAALVLSRLGFAPWFRYQKYREEFRSGDVIAAIDETPAGVFVELEGPEDAIIALAARLGRTPADFILDSYRGIWVKARGADPGDMLF